VEWWGAVWVLVPVAAIVAWAIRPRSEARGRQRGDDQMAAALTQSAESNRLLSERVEQLDRRLAAIEKTLNEIP